MALLKIPITLVLIMFLASMGNAGEYKPEKHLWKHRVVLLFAPDAEHPEYREITAELAAQRPATEERDIVIYKVLPGGEGSEKTRKTFSVDAEEFAFVLIGKDGGEKLRTDSPQLADVFALIDSMPMRQQEMRQDAEE